MITNTNIILSGIIRWPPTIPSFTLVEQIPIVTKDEIDYGQEPVQNRNFTENLVFKCIKLENQLIEKYFQKMANIVNKKIEYVLRT